MRGIKMNNIGHQSTNNRETIVGEFDLLVTKTDKKGRLTYTSKAFQRIAELTEAEMLGQPHNIIRHPDMPRAVFYHLWTYINKGEEVFAFVKNRTKSGGFYWVLAHVTPITSMDTGETYGYHSSRRRMPPHVRSDVEALYENLRKVEAGISHPKEAAIAAHKALFEKIGAQSSIDYTKWLFNLVAQQSLAA
jgi:PAS domain S-box-containing protein